jgi:CRISPR/Cas system CSM-associated protein Csm4 (group 5 of RAMP superfamily)
MSRPRLSTNEYCCHYFHSLESIHLEKKPLITPKMIKKSCYNTTTIYTKFTELVCPFKFRINEPSETLHKRILLSNFHSLESIHLEKKPLITPKMIKKSCYNTTTIYTKFTEEVCPFKFRINEPSETLHKRILLSTSTR